MKVLVLGGKGMLGHKLLQFLQTKVELATILRNKNLEFEKLNLDKNCKIYEQIDVRNFDSVENIIKDLQPNVIINAVGVVKQSDQVTDELLTLDINSLLPKKLESKAIQYGYRFITISTDCVFDGKKGNYTENDLPNAEDLYGKSKYLGEVSGHNCLTIRTSIIGRELETRQGLVEWYLNSHQPIVKGYENAIFSGFPTIVLSRIIWEIIKNHSELQGVYHISSEPINKFNLLKLIKSAFESDTVIEPFREFYMDRSLNSDKFRNLTGFRPESWQEMIAEMAEDSKLYTK